MKEARVTGSGKRVRTNRETWKPMPGVIQDGPCVACLGTGALVLDPHLHTCTKRRAEHGYS